ncbi:hypothetical protein Leryth_007773 [Lithospermum erythrorhizon]|nr:hypothetical protein Leryth_007773 [Lithospermum erythrorhizon]
MIMNKFTKLMLRFEGSKINGSDLRLKLMRKRMSESQQSVEIHGSVTRAVKSVEKSERSSVSSIPSSNGERPRMDSPTRAYSSKAPVGLRLKSVDAIAKASPPVADVRNVNEMRQVPSSRLTNLSGSRLTASSDVVKTSLSNIPVPVPTRLSLDARKQATAPPVATTTMPRSPQMNARPLTMNSFLHSLGLEKYAIHFQAEEIDMAVLKQMGDRDLKELGLPMGPRKKILLAMMPPARRPAA